MPIQTPLMPCARDTPLACHRSWLLAVLALGSNGGGCTPHRGAAPQGLQSHNDCCCTPLPGSTGPSTSWWLTCCGEHQAVRAAARGTTHARCIQQQQGAAHTPIKPRGRCEPEFARSGARKSTTNHKSRCLSVVHLPTKKSSIAVTHYLRSLSNKTKCKRITFIHKMYGKL